MFVLRNQPRSARFALFGLGLSIFALMPTEIGYQDIAALLARQPGVAEHWQQFLFASSRRNLQVASFNLPRPVGTHVPETASYRLASLEHPGIDVTGVLRDNPLGQVLRP